MQVNAGAVGGQSFPNLYIDKNGAAHLVYIVRNGTASVWYTKNANPRDGSGWITPFSISADSGLNVTYPGVTADWDGNAYVVWHQVDKSVTSVMLLYMIDGAWGTAQNISNLPDLSEIAYCAVNGATHERNGRTSIGSRTIPATPANRRSKSPRKGSCISSTSTIPCGTAKAWFITPTRWLRLPRWPPWPPRPWPRSSTGCSSAR